MDGEFFWNKQPLSRVLGWTVTFQKTVLFAHHQVKALKQCWYATVLVGLLKLITTATCWLIKISFGFDNANSEDNFFLISRLFGWVRWLQILHDRWNSARYISPVILFSIILFVPRQMMKVILTLSQITPQNWTLQTSGTIFLRMML